MQMTGEEIRTRGLAALKRELGVAGMLRFLQQFENGSGDWATQRQEWLDHLKMGTLKKQLTRQRRKRRM